MKKIYGYKIYIVSICMLISASILCVMARFLPSFAEIYASTFYKIWATVFSRLCSYIPISVFEALMVLLVIYLGDQLWRAVVRIRKDRTRLEKEWKAFVKIAIPTILCAVSGVWLLFMISCGVNYHRVPFSTVEGIETYPYSKDDLLEVCEYLTTKVNLSAEEVIYDDNECLKPQPEVEKRAAITMKKVALTYPSLAGFYPKAKKFYIYQGLSSQGITGAFISFTMEPHYNDDMPYYNLPYTLCHELSHLRGFMREDEAGFIAYLACVDSDYEDFVYSGYLTAYVYCMNSLYKADKEAYFELRDKLCKTASSDLEYNNAYWEQHDGFMTKATDKVNDTYLKANAQKDGIIGYGRMTDLVVAKYLKDKQEK